MNTIFLKEITTYLSNKNCELIAVTKTHPVETLKMAYEAGLRLFGENKAQEMTEKYHLLPKDIQWHMIGHLQSNKVKYIAPYVSLIHSVDSLPLLEEINKQALKNSRTIDCLLQIHIAKEETKFGLDLHEAAEITETAKSKNLNNICIKGLMGMASNTVDENLIRNEFRKLKQLFDSLKSENVDFTVLSMGMSNDYKIAVEEGSTLIRVGSALFGTRNYSN